MKNVTLILLAVLSLGTALNAAPEAPKPSPAEFVPVAVHTAVIKERDDARSQAALVPQLQQNVQYLQILAERNELALRLVQKTLEETTARANELHAQLNTAKGELEKKNAPIPETKK